ncbi:MAG: hypothetical protein ACRD16_05705 [Thermoanaerobaculia bacterium]
METQIAEARKQKSEKAFEFVLFLVAIFISLQTLLAFFTLDRAIRGSPTLWYWVSGIVSVAVVVYTGIVIYRRPRRRKHR